MSCKGVIFALELGVLPLKQRSAIRQRIEAAGGSVSATVSAAVHVLITTDAELTRKGYKVSTALSLALPIFIHEDLDAVLAAPPALRPKKSSTQCSTLFARVEEPSLFSSTATVDESSQADLFSPLFGSSSSVPPETPVSSFNQPFHVDSTSSYISLTPSRDERLLSSNGSSRAAAPVTSDYDEPSFLTTMMDFGDVLDSYVELSPKMASTVCRPSLAAPSAPVTSSATQSASRLVSSVDCDNFFALFEDDAPRTTQQPRAPSAASFGLAVASSSSVVAPSPALASASSVATKVAPVLTALTSTSASTKSSRSVMAKPSLQERLPRTKTLPQTSTGLKQSPAMLARAAKYQAIVSKEVGPLVPTPISVAPLPVTPLAFDLKPSRIQFKPRVQQEKTTTPTDHHNDASANTSRSGTDSSSLSTPSSPRSSASSTSSRTSQSMALFQDTSSQENAVDNTHHDDVDDLDDCDEDLASGVNVAVLMDGQDFTADAKLSAKKQKHVKVPRVYVDKRTGIAWQRKVVKPLNKLVLDHGDGLVKVMKLVNNITAKLPAASSPTKPSADADDLPALPCRPSALPKKPLFTGPVRPNIKWTDIVTGKATTTKRVPAMDGFKLFVGCVSFDDIALHGKPREQQFAAYKEAYLQKLKDQNKKAISKLKKKAKKAALENATADAQGNVTVAKVATPKLSMDRQIERMKTDQQLLNEIVQWPAKRVEAAIEQRKLIIMAIFKRFGEVRDFSPDWDKGFIHVTYKATQSAQAAQRSLQDFDNRVGVLRALRDSFSKAPKECFPSPSFYVRWTACYQRKLTTQKRIKAEKSQAKHDAQVAKSASNAIAAVKKASAVASSSNQA